MSVKIVHAADFHLDSAFGALSAEQARQRRRESRELLTRLCNYVNQNGVDLVLLAGDLFDSDTTYRETLEALSEALGGRRTYTSSRRRRSSAWSFRSFSTPCTERRLPRRCRMRACLRASAHRRTISSI